LRLLAKGAALLRNDDPEAFDELKDDVLSFRARLRVVRGDPGDLKLRYERTEVWWFTLKNLAAMLVGFPLFLLGLVLFAGPFLVLRGLSLVLPLSRDRVATLKFVGALVVVPSWWAALTVAGWAWWGTPGLLGALFGSLPLALFTRYFLERREVALNDVLTFLRLGNRAKLRQHLLYEGERLQEELHAISERLRPRL
jgi:hypothetical protein